MLSQNPDLDGIWAVWDVPAEGVLAAARAAGRDDLKIATEDLGKNVAIALAKDELVVGLGAQRPFDQGVTEAGWPLAPARQGGPALRRPERLPVTHENVLEAWKKVYHEEPPADLQILVQEVTRTATARRGTPSHDGEIDDGPGIAPSSAVRDAGITSPSTASASSMTSTSRSPRRGPRARRRQRRRQVDADEDPAGRLHQDAGEIQVDGEPVELTSIHDGQRRRHRHGVPGVQPGARP